MSLFLHHVSIFWLEHLYILNKIQRPALKVNVLWCKTGIHSWNFSEKVTAQKMKFSIKDSFSKCDQIRRKLRIWSHLLKKSLMENLIFCAGGILDVWRFTSNSTSLQFEVYQTIFCPLWHEKLLKVAYSLQNLPCSLKLIPGVLDRSVCFKIPKIFLCRRPLFPDYPFLVILLL